MQRIITLVLAMMLPTLASAADLGGSKMHPVQYEDVSSGSWSGVYIGGHVGYGWNEHEATVSERKRTEVLGLNSDGVFGGIRVGVDYQPKSSRLVFGVFGDFNFASNDASVYDATVSDENSYMVAGRVGALLNDKTLLYVLGGYGWQDTAYSGYGYSIDKTFGHLVTGGGFEYKVAKNVTIGVELQHWFAENETVFDVGGLKIDDERSDTRALARVNYRFDY
jgi:outer membrane immunogenic protein